jgi:hypothetical protein
MKLTKDGLGFKDGVLMKSHWFRLFGKVGKGRGSQITIFVVLGIIVLLVAALIAYLNGFSPTPSVPAPTKQSEVELYVSKCVALKTQEALTLIGFQGGYLHTDQSKKLVAKLDPMTSEYLALADGKLLLPYWYYQDESGMDSSNMPALTKSYTNDGSIQDQLEQYVDANINSCLDGFKKFREEGYQVKVGDEHSAQVVFTDSRVVVELTYPVELTRASTNEKYDSFSAEIPVRLKKIYALSKEIRDYEISSVFLERQTKDFITAYSRVNKSYLPPMYGGMYFSPCSDRVFWMYSDVEKNFRTMLASNVPYMKIANTDYTPVVIDKKDMPDDKDRAIAQGVMNGMVKKVSANNYPFMKVDFSYTEDMPLELDLGTRGLLEPNSFDVDLLFSQFCLFEYKYFYSVKYPLVATVVDSKSMINNQPYVFQFPMMVVIKDNFPRLKYSDVFGAPDSGAEKSYQCSPEQRLSGPVSIKVKDDLESPIENARVMFQCGPSVAYKYTENGTLINASMFADRCYMGMTDSKGVLDISFPPCIGGGTITVDHDKYLGISDLVGDIKEGQAFGKQYTMSRVVEKEIEISKYFVNAAAVPGMGASDSSPGIVLDANDEVVGCNLKSEKAPLQEYENVLVRLTRKNTDNAILQGQPFAMYNPTQATTLKLAPGNYTVDILLIRNERYKGEMTILKGSEYKYIKGTLASDSKTIYYPDEDVEIPTTFSGGAEFDWEITPEDLYASNKLTFNIIDEGAPKFVENVGRPIKDRQNCVALNWEKMKPRFD